MAYSILVISWIPSRRNCLKDPVGPKECDHFQILLKICAFFSNLDSFSFSSLISMARTSKTMLNNSDESGPFCFIPNLRRNAVRVLLLRIIFAVGLSYMVLIMLR